MEMSEMEGWKGDGVRRKIYVWSGSATETAVTEPWHCHWNCQYSFIIDVSNIFNQRRGFIHFPHPQSPRCTSDTQSSFVPICFATLKGVVKTSVFG